MQQRQNFAGSEDGSDGGAQHQQMEDMTRLTNKKQMANFLTYGKWDLNDASIEKLIKDDERKERVSIFLWTKKQDRQYKLKLKTTSLPQFQNL